MAIPAFQLLLSTRSNYTKQFSESNFANYYTFHKKMREMWSSSDAGYLVTFLKSAYNRELPHPITIHTEKDSSLPDTCIPQLLSYLVLL